MRLAERLADCSLGGKVFLCNSGAEAIECAIKLARRRRPGGEFVVLEGGFHGRTMGALSATPQEAKQAPFAPLVPGFTVVPRDGRRRCERSSERTAAVLIEPIQGEGGIHPIDPELLAAAREACDEHGALLIFDEIQCGMGRTGTLWAWQQLGVRAGRDDRGQGAGRRPADRRLRDRARVRGRAPARRPRLDLRGRAGDRRGGERRARHGRRRGLPRRGARARASGSPAGLRDLGLDVARARADARVRMPTTRPSWRGARCSSSAWW